MMEFNMPESPKTIYHSQLQLVDSVEALENGQIASKCALHGVIYIWNLEQTMKECKAGNNVYNIIPSHVLKWSDTDNYFMNLGFSKGKYEQFKQNNRTIIKLKLHLKICSTLYYYCKF